MTLVNNINSKIVKYCTNILKNCRDYVVTLLWVLYTCIRKWKYYWTHSMKAMISKVAKEIYIYSTIGIISIKLKISYILDELAYIHVVLYSLCKSIVYSYSI